MTDEEQKLPSSVDKEAARDRERERFQALAAGLPRARSEGGILVVQKREAIEAILPADVAPETFLTAAIAETNELPQGATALSVAIAVFNAASLGLIFGKIRGEAYLVPFRDRKESERLGKDVVDVQLVIGYQGFRNLAYASGFLRDFTTEVILEGESIELFMDEDGRKMRHELPIMRRPDSAGKNVVGSYCVYHTRTGGRGIVVVGAEELKSIASGKIWREHFPAMAKKTAIRRAAKEWALTGKLQAATVLDEQAENNFEQTPNFDAEVLLEQMNKTSGRRKTGISSVQKQLQDMRKGSNENEAE